MRTQSKEEMPRFEPSGSRVTLFWDHKIIERQTMDGELELYHGYAYCVSPVATSYQALVSAIIRSQYSADQELAAINNGGKEHDDYQSMRMLAKSLAREYLGMPPMTLEEKRERAQLSRAGFKLALLAGGYLDAIEAAYPTWPREVQIMWDDSLYFERMHPSLLQLAAAMGYSEAEVDALFGLVDDGPG